VHRRLPLGRPARVGGMILFILHEGKGDSGR
jgi:hypothetical protein